MKKKCPECKGLGEFEGPTFEIEWRGRKADLPSVIPCPACNGTGEAKEKEDEIQTRLGLPLRIQPKRFVDLFSFFSRDGIQHWGIYHCNV